MKHPIYRVRSFEIVAPYTLRIQFDDDTWRTINFLPVLMGELYGPLRDLAFFNCVRIDPEVHTLVWPNGADFDPATLHDWPERTEVTAPWINAPVAVGIGETPRTAQAEIREARVTYQAQEAMGPDRILAAIERLTPLERLAICEAILHLIRQDLQAEHPAWIRRASW